MRMITRFIVPIHAVLKVSGKKNDPKLIQGRSKGRHLRQDIDAVPLLVHHLFDAIHLAGHARDTIQRVLLNFRFHIYRSSSL